MTDVDAMLATVLERPDDIAARLAYADALGDDPRAEYIRIMLTAVSAERRGQLPTLTKEHMRAWLAPVSPFVEVAGFQRGFIEYIRTDAARFIAHAETLFRLAPIRDADLTAATSCATELFACPWLARLRSLDLSGNAFDDTQVAALACSPYLGDLRWLDLSRNRIGMAGLEALAASTTLRSLTWLGFAGNAVADPAPEVFTDNGTVGHVEVPELNRHLIARFGTKRWLTPHNGQPSRSDC
jgi:uncharacterized protein (TIGR02996 family)